MGLFGRKKEKNKFISISGEQLCLILEQTIPKLIQAVENKTYYDIFDFMFDYENKCHFVGVTYDEKMAKKDKRVTFSYELMSIFIDEKKYVSIEEMCENAIIDGVKLVDIKSGIHVDPVFGDMLDK